MHRCLTVVEVQHAIFREVHNEPQGKATIAGLARTCRTFSNTALDVLWKELTSVVYLIRCLPTDLWKLEHVHGGEMVKFQRAMSRSDWETFFRYSSRVRSLSAFDSESYLWHSCYTRLADDVILTLSHPPGYGSLFPCLKTFHWTRSHEEYAPLLRAMLSDSLVNLTLPCLVLRSPITSILLTSRCPSLRNLCIQTESTQDTRNRNRISHPLPQKFLSETILHLHSLEFLECCALDKEAISHLSRLPSLVKLIMELPDDLLSQQQTPTQAPLAFASLESLTIKATMLPTLTSFLEIVRFKPQGVSFIVKSIPTPDMLCLLFMSIVNACDSEQLSRISLAMESPPACEWHHDTERPQVTLSTFWPLLKLPNVTSLAFNVMCNISLDDDAIESLTSPWSKLTSLFLNATFGLGVDSAMTHRGLILLLSHCSMLTEFALAVDFAEIDQPNSQVPTSRPGRGITSHCQSAYFVGSAIEHPVSVAAFLSDICPRLRKVRLLPISVPDSRIAELQGRMRKWEEVNSLFPALLAVRKQCMEWHEGQVEAVCVRTCQLL